MAKKPSNKQGENFFEAAEHIAIKATALLSLWVVLGRILCDKFSQFLPKVLYAATSITNYVRTLGETAVAMEKQGDQGELSVFKTLRPAFP